MSTLSVNRTAVAKANIQNVNLGQTCGAFEVCFVITGTVIVPTGEIHPRWYMMHGARASASTNGRTVILGLAVPDAPPLLLQDRNPYELHIELKLVLQANQFAALEDIRNGGDIDFQLSVSGAGAVVKQGRDRETSHDVLYYKAPQSEWIKQLYAAKALNVLLLEVAMPFVEPSPSSAAIDKYLRRAVKHYAEGNFGDCVAECRKASEQLPIQSRSAVKKNCRVIGMTWTRTTGRRLLPTC